MDTDPLVAFLELWSFDRALQAALVVVCGWLLVTGLRWGIDHLAGRAARHRLRVARMYPLLRHGVWTLVVLIVVFGVLRPPTGVMVALVAAGGLALGLASQDLMRNLFSGTIMLFDPPYRVGDMVSIGGHYGEIIAVELVLTRLRTFDDNVVSVPNALVFQGAVSNANGGELTEQVAISVDLDAGVDPVEVRALAWEAAASSPYCYLKAPINVLVSDRNELRALTRYTIKAYVVDVRLERMLASDVTLRLKRALLQRGLVPSAAARL